MQVGAKELKDGNLHSNPDKVEGFVVVEFDLDKLKTERLGWVVPANLPCMHRLVTWLALIESGTSSCGKAGNCTRACNTDVCIACKGSE